MISRAILILKSRDGRVCGTCKLTSNGSWTDLELKTNGPAPDMLGIMSRSRLEILTVGDGNIKLDLTEIDEVVVGCIRGKNIYLIGANSSYDDYAFSVAVERYLDDVAKRHMVKENNLDTLERERPVVEEMTIIDSTDTTSVATEEFTEGVDDYEPIQQAGTEIADDIGDYIADDVVDADFDDPILVDEETVYTELREETHVTVEKEEGRAYLFEEIAFNKKENSVLDFYYSVKETLDELFVCFPAEENIQKLIPGRWVRIDSEEGYYVVGITYADDKPTYICYGVPKIGDSEPPEDIRPYCELIENDELSYWVMFQDANTGVQLKKPTNI